MKKCKKCKIEKELVEFFERKINKDGYTKLCKNCINKSRVVLDEKICNKCKQVKNSQCFYHNNRNYDGLCTICKECDKSIKRNKKDSDAKYYMKNKSDISKNRIEYRKNNNDIINKRQRKYYTEQNEKINENRRKYKKARLKIDVIYKLQYNISNLIRASLLNNEYSKKSRTYEILGCSYKEFKIFIQGKFEYWMNWSNHGNYTGNYNETWQLDHIIPISSGVTEIDIIKLNHFTNFQPLCSKKNMEKSNYIL